MKQLCVVGALSILVAGGSAAHAQQAAALQVRALAATCASCHGTDGRAIPSGAVPGLAGMPAGYFVEQMKGFQSGTRNATVMHQLAKGFNEVQIQQLAAYFAAQPK
ncbi:MAG TPA: c-type cytochrome [Albitalea sp.]